MNHRFTSETRADELFRLKKALQFIRQVVSDYGNGTLKHLGFAHALAISRAAELRDQVEPFCPAYDAFQELVKAVTELPLDPSACSHAECALNEIAAYFELDHIILIRR